MALLVEPPSYRWLIRGRLRASFRVSTFSRSGPLNVAAFPEKALPLLSGYGRVCLLLDNDAAGRSDKSLL
ncbi:hypothetical protein [Pontibacter litorisediminis]|uniref:hypothetical protein n=1 Tax=Pontibacter litorisediminis TaxID=1846260 RepID=UPI0023ED6732|nr:hypothetical protein [Pontibacter litorisediminis]